MLPGSGPVVLVLSGLGRSSPAGRRHNFNPSSPSFTPHQLVVSNLSRSRYIGNSINHSSHGSFKMSFYNMSRLRPAARLFAVGIGATACVGATTTLLRRTPIRFDAPAQPTALGIRQHESPSAHISPSMVEQLSSGSVTGTSRHFGTAPEQRSQL